MRFVTTTTSSSRPRSDWERFGDEAARGIALWKVAWDGEDVVGQVRTRVAEGEAARIGRRTSMDRGDLDTDVIGAGGALPRR